MPIPTDVALWLLGGLFSVLFWLLRNKDEAQAEHIKLLFKKHDDDVAALQELRVQIASRHYEKEELDVKFDKLERTTSDGFRALGEKFDRLSDALLSHVSFEERSGR